MSRQLISKNFLLIKLIVQPVLKQIKKVSFFYKIDAGFCGSVSVFFKAIILTT